MSYLGMMDGWHGDEMDYQEEYETEYEYHDDLWEEEEAA